jgi:CRISPR-associated protein Cas2
LFCLLFYDVNAHRVQKIHRYLKKKMFWVQNSAFEGELSPFQYGLLQRELGAFLVPEEDTLLFVRTEVSHALTRTLVGVDKGGRGWIE